MLFLFRNDDVWNPWLWAPSEMTTGCCEASFLFFDNQLRMPGGRDTINCQMSGPWDSSWIKCPGFAWEGILAAGNRDLSKLGRERRRERYKTIDLIAEHIYDSTWECNQLATFPLSSFVNRTWKVHFCFFQRTWTTKHELFQSPCCFKIKVYIFYVHTALSKIK